MTFEEAFFAVHDVLPPYWQVGPVTWDPGRRAFIVTARRDSRRRGVMPDTVSGAGETEITALRALREALTGRTPDPDDAAKREALRRRLRMAIYQGAAEWGRAEGQELSADELGRVLERFPGWRHDRRREERSPGCNPSATGRV